MFSALYFRPAFHSLLLFVILKKSLNVFVQSKHLFKHFLLTIILKPKFA